MNKILIKAKETDRYLSDIFNINSEHGSSLPRNCLFNKVTTGCGGTYVALNDPEPTIIIVPTKALVRDKVTQEKYKHLNLLGISSDYPLTKIPEGCSKIICTYQSLPMLAEKIVISNWNLVIDEMHLLTRMLSFSRSSLGWLLNNFKNFKSYCFMSATIPKRELLLDELKEIDMVEIQWPNLEPVSFECYHSSNIYETMLQICGEHLDGTREGNAYFFYNTVDGICKLVTTIRKIPEYKHKFACMVSDSKYTKEKLRKVGTSIKTPSQFSKINFVTSASFEGVDFYDPEGVTYIVSDSKYEYTKYNIITTIPQIVGRLRDSKYNKRVTVLFNNHEILDARTPEEFNEYIESRIQDAEDTVDIYKYSQTKKGDSARIDILRGAVNNIYLEVEGLETTLEEISFLELTANLDLKVYPQAKLLDLELYDLLNTNIYINSDKEASKNHIVHSLSEVIGEAPALDSYYMQVFKSRSYGLEKLCKIYEESPAKCQEIDPEMYEYIITLGVERIASCGFKKVNVKALYNHLKKSSEMSTIHRIKNTFKVGETYSNTFIKKKLQSFGLAKAKASTLAEYFKIKPGKTTKRENGYKIMRGL